MPQQPFMAAWTLDACSLLANAYVCSYILISHRIWLIYLIQDVML
jgi:hypothetical protein